jgi:hypothetical protein
MKFISKLPNYRVVLKPGLPGNRQLGTASTSMLAVRFENGMAEVRDKAIIEMMLAHPGCGNKGEKGTDFMPLEEGETDIYAKGRPDIEPMHTMTNIDYGHIGTAINAKRPATLSADQMDLVKKLATEMAMEIIKQSSAAKTSVEQPFTTPALNSFGSQTLKEEKIYRSAPLEDFSKLAPEPIEDDSDNLYGEGETVVAPKIDMTTTGEKIGGVEGDANVTPIEPIVETPKKRGRPAAVK